MVILLGLIRLMLSMLSPQSGVAVVHWSRSTKLTDVGPG